MSTTTAQRRKPSTSASAVEPFTSAPESSSYDSMANQSSVIVGGVSSSAGGAAVSATKAATAAAPPSGNSSGLVNHIPHNHPMISHHPHHPVQNLMTATVRRRKFGTSPFDENWLNLDPCGLFCGVMTYMLHFYGVYAVNWVLIPPWMSYYDSGMKDDFGDSHGAIRIQKQRRQLEEGDEQQLVRHLTWTGWFHCILFLTIAVLAVTSHFKAMTTDPGAVPPDAKPIEHLDDEEENRLVPRYKQKGLRLCRRCNAFKPNRAHHCSVCRRCIIKMDHHCPWVNNCVGIGNHKFFLLFVFYTFLSCCYSMTLVIWRFWQCISIQSTRLHHRHHHEEHTVCLDEPSHLLLLLGLLVEGLLFGMFTSCMMIDQTDVVRSKMTHIDRIKKPRMAGPTNARAMAAASAANASSQTAVVTGFGEVFGVNNYSKNNVNNIRFQTHWLSPFVRVTFPPSLKDEIMGFCRPSMKASTTTNNSNILMSNHGNDATNTAMPTTTNTTGSDTV